MTPAALWALITSFLGLPAAINNLIASIESLSNSIRVSNNANVQASIVLTDLPKAKTLEDYQALAKKIQDVQANK